MNHFVAYSKCTYSTYFIAIKLFCCRDTNRYVEIQSHLEEFYSFMQEFVIKEEFQTHIKKDGHDLDGIEEKLRFGRNDVMKTECPIVIAGKQSYNL